MKSPASKDSCCRFNIIDQNIMECSFETLPPDRLKACIVRNSNKKKKQEEVEAYRKTLDGSCTNQSQSFTTLKTKCITPTHEAI